MRHHYTVQVPVGFDSSKISFPRVRLFGQAYHVVQRIVKYKYTNYVEVIRSNPVKATWMIVFRDNIHHQKKLA
jgi:hypothetical protein